MAELFPDDEDSPEDIAEIQAARADYKTGDYTIFEQYMAQRTGCVANVSVAICRDVL